MSLFTGTEAQCIGHFKLIFSLLRMTKATKLQKFALEVRRIAFNNVTVRNNLLKLNLNIHVLLNGLGTLLMKTSKENLHVDIRR